MSNKVKKLVIYSIVLMVVGFVIGGAGFGMLGFKKDKLTLEKNHEWYYTIYYTDGEGWTAGIHN